MYHLVMKKQEVLNAIELNNSRQTIAWLAMGAENQLLMICSHVFMTLKKERF